MNSLEFIVLGFGVQGSRSMVKDPGFEVPGSRFRVKGSKLGIRVHGLGG